MAISPIQMFQNNQSSLAQLLQGGTQTISGIMDQAIQIGRDISNKQLAQERDMLGMRQQETAMAQRRAENLQQNNEDAQRFARSAFESDRRYNTDLAQQGVQNNRQATQDLFQQSNADRNFSLSERNVGVSEGGLQIRQDELAADRATKEANQTYFRDKYSNASAPQQRELQGPTQTGDPLVVNMLSSGTPTINNPDTVKLYEQKQSLENDLRSATEPQVKAQISSMLGTVKGQIAQLPRGSSGSPYAEEDQAMQRAAFQKKQTDDADKAMEEKVLGNTAAFIPQEVVMQKRAKDAKTYDDASKEPTGDEIADSNVYDKDRYVSEKASARKMTLPEYVAKGPQDDASKKAREELWNHVNTGKLPSAPASAEAPNPAKGYFATKRAPLQP